MPSYYYAQNDSRTLPVLHILFDAFSKLSTVTTITLEDYFNYLKYSKLPSSTISILVPPPSIETRNFIKQKIFVQCTGVIISSIH